MFDCFVHFVELAFFLIICYPSILLIFCMLSYWKSLWGPTFYTLGLKAKGFLFRIDFLAALIKGKCSGKFEQFLHMQVGSQNLPYVKHSQYIFKHLLLLHLQVRLATVLLLALIIVNCWSIFIVLCLLIVFLPRPLVFLFVDELGDKPSVSCSDYFKIESFVF